MNIIDILYSAEKGLHQPSEEYLKELNIALDNEELLSSRLSGENLKIFNEFTEATNNIMHINSLDSFRTGFRLGAQLMMELFKPNDEEI